MFNIIYYVHKKKIKIFLPIHKMMSFKFCKNTIRYFVFPTLCCDILCIPILADKNQMLIQ